MGVKYKIYSYDLGILCKVTYCEDKKEMHEKLKKLKLIYPKNIQKYYKEFSNK